MGRLRRGEGTRTSDITTGREGLAGAGAHDDPAKFRVVPLLDE